VKRPFGITLLAIIWAAAGIAYIIVGLQLTTAVTFGPLPTGQGTWIWGWLIAGTGLLFWAAAGAAWSLQAWAWQLGVILAIFGLLEAFFMVIGVGTIEYALASTAWPLLALWYLHREPVKKAFGITEA
jgi:hypothetical protein